MTKYTEQVREIRKLARKYIPELLEAESLAANSIVEQIGIKFQKNCDNSVKCDCGKGSERPEWKHQVLWAIQDCKYHKKITFEPKSKTYSLKK